MDQKLRLPIIALIVAVIALIVNIVTFCGCTAPTDPAPVIQPPMDKRIWHDCPDDERDTFPDTLGEPDTLTYEQRGIPVNARDGLPDSMI